MTSVREDLEQALREYEEEERKRRERELRQKEEKIRQSAQKDIENMYQQYLEDGKGCYMDFNGTNLGLIKDRKLFDNLDAISGQSQYQAKEYQNLRDFGPIPEGTYYAPQSQRQEISPFDVGFGIIGKAFNKGKWIGGPVSWGTKRVWLRPDEKTNTYKRSNFSIHGGWSKGSRGCIDIPYQTDKLWSYLDGCEEDEVPLYVKYKRKHW